MRALIAAVITIALLVGTSHAPETIFHSGITPERELTAEMAGTRPPLWAPDTRSLGKTDWRWLGGVRVVGRFVQAFSATDELGRPLKPSRALGNFAFGVVSDWIPFLPVIRQHVPKGTSVDIDVGGKTQGVAIRFRLPPRWEEKLTGRRNAGAYLRVRASNLYELQNLHSLHLGKTLTLSISQQYHSLNYDTVVLKDRYTVDGRKPLPGGSASSKKSRLTRTANY